MAREVPDAFTRDEWAYLITFLDPSNLRLPYQLSFGERVDNGDSNIFRLIRRRGNVSIWLPNNVSLLGPLTLVLLSLTGNRLHFKGASRADGVTGKFLEYARSNVPPGPLRQYLETDVEYMVFDRADERNRAMAAVADVRIAFGSDEAVKSILALDHPLDSVGISFADRQSEAWIEKDSVTDSLLGDLIKVFAVYGQAGCTSPRRVVILDATAAETIAVRDRVREIWPEVIRRAPAPHVASDNVMLRQCLAAQGWDAVLAPQSAAVLACGTSELEAVAGRMMLTFMAADMDAAARSLPKHIQTIGYGTLSRHPGPHWLDVLSRTAALRLVPISQMHHFGPVWDGQNFWRQSFVEVEVA